MSSNWLVCWDFSFILSAVLSTGPSSPQEAAAAGWRDRHVPGLQIRGDVPSGDLRLCLRDGQGLHHCSDQRHGNDYSASAEVSAGPPPPAAVPQKGLQDLWGVARCRCGKLFSSTTACAEVKVGFYFSSGNCWTTHPGQIPAGALHGWLRHGSFPALIGGECSSGADSQGPGCRGMGEWHLKGLLSSLTCLGQHWIWMSSFPGCDTAALHGVHSRDPDTCYGAHR